MVVWADNIAYALHELQQHDMPVLLDLSRGATALQHARDLKSHRAATLMFAVVVIIELTTEAVLAGVADVFARPLGGRRVASAIDREIESSLDAKDHGAHRRPGIEAALYCHSAPMQEVSALIARAASMKAGVMILGEEGTGRRMVARGTVRRRLVAVILTRPTSLTRPTCHDSPSSSPTARRRLAGKLFGTMERPPTAAGPSIERVSRKSLLFAARGGTLYFHIHRRHANARAEPARASAARPRSGIG